MFSVLPGGTGNNADETCPVSGEPTDNLNVQACTVQKLNARAQLQIKTISYDNSETDRTSTTEKSYKVDSGIHGEVKMSGALFKAINLEASISRDYSSETMVKVTMDKVAVSRFENGTKTCTKDNYVSPNVVMDDYVPKEDKK
ncbi:hypothetical protein BGW38_002973 [Lunasporangiospora selenospora]|uniref:Uncharacterized protein n=1 Tax=Lunasporangiospora selenospora TaxID=979761 RepID=A0A9P6G0N1_9FUNG|nr:hypothetical protein BGW38_002973 [Lunasporangiospora selenospora]